MNEVEKMYENTKLLSYYCGDDYIFDAMLEVECTNGDKEKCKTCDKAKVNHPPFTAEKQIAIFKMFCRRYLEVSQHVEENGDLCFGIKATVGDYAVGFNKDFAECLADFVNCLWQDLTEEERKQIKEILE